MSEIDFEDALFFAYASQAGLPLGKSLASLTGFPSQSGPYATSMIQRCEEAWSMPLQELSCEQVRLLLGQRMGLDWLGKPILDFVSKWPAALVANYPGEMTCLCLNAAEELSKFAPAEFRIWLGRDFGWLEEAFDWDDTDEVLSETKEQLAAARALMRLQ